MPKLTPLKWFVLLSTVAIVLALGLPPDPKELQQLQVSGTTYRLAITALLIPYVLIWYASFYAFAKLKEYSTPLKNTKDGEALKKITLGMGVLSFSLIMPTIVSLILNNVATHNESFEAASVIINNYLGLFPGLLSFLLLYNGARALLRTAKGAAEKLDIRKHAPWFLLLAVAFSHLTIENHYQSDPYHLHIVLLVVTYIVPYLYGWMVGLLCAYDLDMYAKVVRGNLYKKGIKQLANGIFIAILGSIAIQFVNITFAKRFDDSLGAILLISYALLMLVGAGLLMIALGTKKLKTIEEV